MNNDGFKNNESSMFRLLLAMLLYSIIFFCCISGQYYISIKDHNLAIGMLIFPMTYIINAANTEIFYFQYARQTIATIAINTIFLGLLIRLFGLGIFSDAYINDVITYNHFCMRLRALLCFTGLGFFISEYMNSYIITKLKLLWSGRHLIRRVTIAIFVAIIIDTTIFIPFMFARHKNIEGIIFEWLIDVLVRGGIAFLFLPILKIIIYYYNFLNRESQQIMPPEYAREHTSIEYLKNAQ